MDYLSFDYEVIGVFATLFVLISFIMKDVRSIRFVNMIGAILFVIYGFGISAFSVWFMNGILIIIHCVKLREIKK